MSLFTKNNFYKSFLEKSHPFKKKSSKKEGFNEEFPFVLGLRSLSAFTFDPPLIPRQTTPREASRTLFPTIEPLHGYQQHRTPPCAFLLPPKTLQRSHLSHPSPEPSSIFLIRPSTFVQTLKTLDHQRTRMHPTASPPLSRSFLKNPHRTLHSDDSETLNHRSSTASPHLHLPSWTALLPLEVSLSPIKGGQQGRKRGTQQSAFSIFWFLSSGVHCSLEAKGEPPGPRRHHLPEDLLLSIIHLSHSYLPAFLRSRSFGVPNKQIERSRVLQ